MSLVGLGRAFNLKYRPNGPLRLNCYHRPMPHVGLFGGGGNFSYTENVNIQNGPSGFWGFMTGLTQGLFGGGMFGMGMGGGIFGLLNSRQAATPQGPSQTQGEDAHLKNLTEFYGKSFIIKSHPDKKGIYQAVPKDGGKPIEGTYDELMNKLAEDKETQTVDPSKKKESEKTEAQLKEEKAKEKGLELKDGKYFKGSVEYEWDSTIKDFKEKVPEKSEEDPLSSKDEKPVQSTRTRKSGGRSRTRGAETPPKTEEVKDKKQDQKTKLGITWEITPAYMGHVRSLGYVTVQINGKQVKLTGYSNVPRSVADAKAEIARDIEQQLKDRGVGDKYTVY